LKLFDGTTKGFTNRAHFFAIASKAMRHILVDHARTRSRVKRGSGAPPQSGAEQLEIAVESLGDPATVIDLDRAIEALAKHDAHLARIVEMHYFGGMSTDEIAEALSASVHVVRHDIRYALAWLRRTGLL
jgi:RNA polymerase sigma factor (TIGR02999 family)